MKTKLIKRWVVSLTLAGSVAVGATGLCAGQYSESAPHRCAGCEDGTCQTNSANFGWYRSSWRKWPGTPVLPRGGRKGMTGVQDVQLPEVSEEARFDKRTRSEKPLDDPSAGGDVIATPIPSGTSSPLGTDGVAPDPTVPDTGDEGNPFSLVPAGELPPLDRGIENGGLGGNDAEAPAQAPRFNDENIFDSMESNTKEGVSSPGGTEDGFDSIDFGLDEAAPKPESVSKPEVASAPKKSVPLKFHGETLTARIEPPKTLSLRQVAAAVPVPSLGENAPSSWVTDFSELDLLPPCQEVTLPDEPDATHTRTSSGSTNGPVFVREIETAERLRRSGEMVREEITPTTFRPSESGRPPLVKQVAFQWNAEDGLELGTTAADLASCDGISDASRFLSGNPLRPRLRRQYRDGTSQNAQLQVSNEYLGALTEISRQPDVHDQLASRESPAAERTFESSAVATAQRSLRDTLRKNPLR